MIKLIDLLNEEISDDLTSNKHWRDYFKEIIEHAEEALKSKDPETIATQVHDIVHKAEVALDKHQASYDKKRLPTFVNSNNANSYSGDDSDINAYMGGNLGGGF
jgi:hypothetical protein